MKEDHHKIVLEKFPLLNEMDHCTNWLPVYEGEIDTRYLVIIHFAHCLYKIVDSVSCRVLFTGIQSEVYANEVLSFIRETEVLFI